MKNQKGITLIALVITIIVLLILAGVSIAMLTGDNGILSKAQTAADETLKAEVKERIQIVLNDVKTEIYAQQAEKNSYRPLEGTTGSYTLEATITKVLKDNGFESTSPTSGGYAHNLDASTGILTVSYYNDAKEIGSSSAPVKATINLVATNQDNPSYTISPITGD